MKRLVALLLGTFAVLASPASARPAKDRRDPVVILVSIDGFRADYLDRGITPSLSKLAASGISAAMRPSFPSKTFPNHWALVTGKVPDHNGIIANSFEDPAHPGQKFTMSSDEPYWWDEAEPIWVTAEKAGIRTATMFWPGSNVAWGGTLVTEPWKQITGGTRPSDWQQFNQAASPVQRVNAVLDWLRRPAAIRPRLVTLYFDDVDTAGHRFGPDDPRTNAAIAEIDRDIGALVAGLRELGQRANLIVVADHGMASVSSERTIPLDAVADPALYKLGEAGPFAALAPTPGNEAALAAALLKAHDHMQCWRKQDIPARLRYGTNPRIAPFFCLAETGWQISAKLPAKASTGGTHGYDNAAPEMAALFIASGPDFAKRGKLAPFDNVDVAPLLRDLLKLPQASDGDGNDAPFRNIVKQR
ncbi:ectonucleotide pyrophosphatase/phosphodiesterase [Novosphingobium sp. ST904]|uniref:alkaline phosphatase family protein n=1 Tax=Novosphingobium sp. ST904 TaxID=1684385 RepID=UPI0006C87E8E|nr:ectonucleotide pyrophosphatase/phosphodiesterase [Novosphingobium sp. ST904]KPH66536.1 phosphodiesterase [Novosphingobium sp. ST904]TCM42355.1 putative AlkP superfamily pyrophosphatase or phosphodiesterase [Novosphingobium sp. ST904]